MSETLVWMRKFMEMYGSWIFALLYFFFKTFAGSHLMSLLSITDKILRAPGPWSRGVSLFSCLCSGVIPMPASFPQTFLLCTVQSLVRTIQVLTILVMTTLPTRSADVGGKQESAWEVRGTRGTSTWNLRTAGRGII